MARITYIPNRVIDTDGIADGAGIFVYQTGTTTLVSLFLDEEMTVPTTNPYLVMNGAAVPALYTNYEGDVRLYVESTSGDIQDFDPYPIYLTSGDIAEAPTHLDYGAQTPIRTLRQAVAFCDTAHTGVVGYAAGVTGGFGKTKYLVDNESADPTVPNSFLFSLAAAKANAGGCIHFETRGHLNIYIADDTYLDFDNISLIAPGRNVTFWMRSLVGSLGLTTHNAFIYGIEFRTLPGTLAAYDDSTGIKTEKKLVAVDPTACDMVAFMNCEFRHASDGALDMSGTILAATPQCRVSVQNCIFWDTDQPMMLGSGDPLCTATDPALLKVTLHNIIFAYCGERHPKTLGRTTVDMSNVYTRMLPFQRDQLAPVNEFSACYGADALFGGTLQARGCLWTAADGIGGYAALQVSSALNGASVSVDGAVNATDCATEDNCTITTGNIGRIPALPYTLAHTPVPAAGAARDQWIANLWATCGARINSAPPGLFAWTTDTSRRPNGDDVVDERGKTGRWLRIDKEDDYRTDFQWPLASYVQTLPRGNTIGIVSDAITIDADNSVMTITPETGSADNLVTINGGVEGRYIELHVGSAIQITLKSGGNIDLTEEVYVHRRGRPVALRYISGLWKVLNAPAHGSLAYTPTLTAITNCSALTLRRADYIVIGKRVQVSVVIDGTLTTTATAIQIGVTLPSGCTKDIVNGYDLTGPSRTHSSTIVSGNCTGDTTNDRALINITPSGGNGAAFQVAAEFNYMLV